jgi:hypothetical protein
MTCSVLILTLAVLVRIVLNRVLKSMGYGEKSWKKREGGKKGTRVEGVVWLGGTTD